MTDDELARLRERNLQRTHSAIRALGKHYILHPVHRVRRVERHESLQQ